jgi:hypothetical protein
MKPLLMALGLLLSCLATAQPAQVEDDAFLQAERERERIAQVRQQEEARFAGQEAACYQRFAVNDCLREVRVRRRAVLEDLRRQEVLINDAERKRRGAAQIKRLEERSSAQAQQEEANRRAAAQQEQQQRLENAQRKQQERAQDEAQKAATPPRQSASKPVSGVDRAAEKQRYEDKLREAQEHKAERAKAQADKSGPPARPLPVAP